MCHTSTLPYINSLSLLPLIFSVQLSVAYPYYILEKHYAQSCSKQRLIKQVSCNSKQLNFYKNMLICVGLLYPLITLNFSSFYCVSLFTIAYSCYFFGFYVNCWGEIKISLQFITLFGFHSGGNFSLSAGGCCASSGSRLAGSHLGLCSRRSVKITSEMTFCFSLFNQLAYSFFYIYDEVVHVI